MEIEKYFERLLAHVEKAIGPAEVDVRDKRGERYAIVCSGGGGGPADDEDSGFARGGRRVRLGDDGGSAVT